MGARGRGVTPGLRHFLRIWELGNLQNTVEPAVQLQASVLLGEHMPGADSQKVTQQGDLAQSILETGREQPCPANAQALGCLLRGRTGDQLQQPWMTAMVVAFPQPSWGVRVWLWHC